MQHKNFKTLVDVYIEHIMGHFDCDNYYTEDINCFLSDEKDIHNRIKQHQDYIEEYQKEIDKLNTKINKEYRPKLKKIFIIFFFIIIFGYYSFSYFLDYEITVETIIKVVTFSAIGCYLFFSETSTNLYIGNLENKIRYEALINDEKKEIRLCREELYRLSTDLILFLWHSTPSEKLGDLKALLYKHRYNLGYD